MAEVTSTSTGIQADMALYLALKEETTSGKL